MNVDFYDYDVNQKALLEDTFRYIAKCSKLLNTGDFDTIYTDCISYQQCDPNVLTCILLNSNIDVLNNVSKIYNDMFSYLDIKHIFIPSGIREIGGTAFFSCKQLEDVILPYTLTNIKSSAFSCCSSLKTVTFNQQLDTIGWSVFADCSQLSTIVLPDSVTSLGAFVFVRCENLQEVVIGGGVTSIGKSIFHGDDKLKNIYYNGTKEQFDKIKIDKEGNSWVSRVKYLK